MFYHGKNVHPILPYVSLSKKCPSLRIMGYTIDFFLTIVHLGSYTPSIVFYALAKDSHMLHKLPLNLGLPGTSP